MKANSEPASKNQPNIGDLVFDGTVKKYGLITNKGALVTDSYNQTYRWDFEILYEDGKTGFASADEVEIMNEG